MTVHMVRLLLEPPKGNAESAVDNWVQNHTEWDNDPVAHELIETTTDVGGEGTTYARGDYRFLQEGTATALLDDLESRLQSFQGGLWYRIGYHVCPHDGTVRTVTETHTLNPGSTVDFGWGAKSGTVIIGSGGYTEGEDYVLEDGAGNVGTGALIYDSLTVLDDTSIDPGDYTVEYGTAECEFDGDQTRENGTIPSDIPELT
jgi:hypothetical protein